MSRLKASATISSRTERAWWRHLVVMVLGVASLCASPASIAGGADASGLTNEDEVALWQAALGSSAVENPDVRPFMTYLHPRPRSMFQAMADIQLPKTIAHQWKRWAPWFFVPRVASQFANARPQGYFIPDKEYLPGLLAYDLAVDGIDVSVMENGDMVMVSARWRLHVDADDGSASKPVGVPAEFVRRIVEWLNLDARNLSRLQRAIPQGMVDQDSVLTNVKRRRVEVTADWKNNPVVRIAVRDYLLENTDDWRENVVVIVAEHVVHVILVKKMAGTGQVGLAYRPHWLQGWVHDREGSPDHPQCDSAP